MRETEGREALRAGKRVMRQRGTRKGPSEAGKPGGAKGGPGAESWSPIGFPRVKLDPYLLLASGRVNVGERMGWRAQGREK